MSTQRTAQELADSLGAAVVQLRAASYVTGSLFNGGDREKYFAANKRDRELMDAVLADVRRLAALASQAEPVEAGSRCELVRGCHECQHVGYDSASYYGCVKARRRFDTAGKPRTAPNWCPLPLYAAATPAPAQADQSEDGRDAARLRAELVWVLTEVWPLVHHLNSRDCVRERFLKMKELLK